MTRAETAAFKALIEADAALTGHVFVGVVPDDATVPYVRIWPSVGTDSQDRLTGPYATARPSWVVHAVGLDVEQCEWVTEHVDAALRPGRRGALPVVAGRKTGRIKRDALLPVDIDTDVSPPYIYQPSEYGFRSEPAH